jgi:hypothetical protein
MAEPTRPKWYIQLNGVDEGPMTSQTLRSLAEAGRISPDTPIRKEGMSNTVPASKIKGLLKQSTQKHITAGQVRSDNKSSIRKSRGNSHEPSEEITKKNMVKFYEAILGEKNRAYYLTKFEQFDNKGPGIKASWNWSAFLCGGVWALYRKMYGWFFAFWGIAFLSNIFEKAGAQGISAIIFIVPWVAFAICANSLYQKNLTLKISKAKMAINDQNSLLEYLRHKGGVNTWVIWVFVGIPILGIFAAILIPMFAGK